jgi:hypothetical protein
MTLLGLFEELGASSYTVQVFDRGLLVDSESGLGSAVARTKEYVVQHDQTDMDFLHQRACAQVDLGRELEVTILAPTPRAVLGDRIHIIPEGLQVFPDCVEAVGVRLTKVGDITLKRGVVGVALPPALAFGLSNQAGGDALLKLVNGQLVVANEAWGPGASGPLSGGVRTPVAGLEGFRWQLAGNLDPQQLPPESKRSFRLVVQDANGQLGTAGLDVELQNGSFAIGADYSALGSSDAQLDAYLGPQRVYTGVLHQQGRVLVNADFNEVEYLEDETGNVSFILGWESARTLIIEGQPVVATRLSTRSGHRDRAVTASDFECLLQDTPYAEVHRASVRPHRGWLSAVGEVAFGDFTEMPLLLTHLNPLSATGVEAEAEKDPQGTAYVQLAVEDPELRNTLDGDERVSLLIQEESDAAAKSGLAATKTVYAPGSVVFERLGGAWRVQVDFAAAGYGGFRVMGDGLGELYLSSTPSGEALICDAWPSSMIVEGVDGELWIRLVFDSPATISTPGSRTLSSSGITLAVTGGTHPPFETGQVQFLCEGLPITALGDAQIAVGVPEDHREVPRSTRSVVLRPAVPNPFNPRTLLRYELAQAGEVSLAIYDTAGRRIRTLVEGPRPAGEGTALWDGRDERGQAVASGNYLVQLRSPTGSAQEKIVLVR